MTCCPSRRKLACVGSCIGGQRRQTFAAQCAEPLEGPHLLVGQESTFWERSEQTPFHESQALGK